MNPHTKQILVNRNIVFTRKSQWTPQHGTKNGQLDKMNNTIKTGSSEERRCSGILQNPRLIHNTGGVAYVTVSLKPGSNHSYNTYL